MADVTPKNNNLKAVLNRHGIPEAALLRRMNEGLQPGHADWTPQTTLASYTRFEGRGENCPKLPRAKHICATLKKYWKVKATPIELFPSMQVTAGRRGR